MIIKNITIVHTVLLNYDTYSRNLKYLRDSGSMEMSKNFFYQISRFCTYFAFASINSLRGSTRSPIRVSNVISSSEAASSSIFTRSKILFSGSIVVSHNCSASISPSPLYRWILLFWSRPTSFKISASYSSLYAYHVFLFFSSLYSGGCAKYTCPSLIRSGINRKKNVSISVAICAPSTSASVMIMILS